VKRLKNESDLFAAQAGQIVLTHRDDRFTVDAYVSIGRRIETGNEPKERRLTAARGPNDGNELAIRDGKIQRM
jgi:hypothetical protein